MKRTLVLGLACGAVLSAAAPVAAQRVNPARPESQAAQAPRTTGVIDGAVTDSMLRPIGFAEITILRTDIKLQTNSAGRFRFLDVPRGQYLLIVRRIGFRPVSSIIQVEARDTLRLSFTMETTVQTLETVTVVEERRSLRMIEFDQRRKQGFGFFITGALIEQRNLPVAADYLRFAPGVSLAPSGQASGNPELVAISKREGGSIFGDGAGACAMQVVIDGVPAPPRFPLELLPMPREIAGIEIYNGAATVPPQFSGVDRRCGMILVWTKDY